MGVSSQRYPVKQENYNHLAGNSSGSNTENDNSSTVTPAPVNGADGYSVYTSVCNGKNNFKKQKETVNGTK